jgi:hypothetical protein
MVDLAFMLFNPIYESLALVSPVACLFKQSLRAHFLILTFNVLKKVLNSGKYQY